jgi:hypothetical protein
LLGWQQAAARRPRHRRPRHRRQLASRRRRAHLPQRLPLWPRCPAQRAVRGHKEGEDVGQVLGGGRLPGRRHLRHARRQRGRHARQQRVQGGRRVLHNLAGGIHGCGQGGGAVGQAGGRVGGKQQLRRQPRQLAGVLLVGVLQAAPPHPGRKGAQHRHSPTLPRCRCRLLLLLLLLLLLGAAAAAAAAAGERVKAAQPGQHPGAPGVAPRSNGPPLLRRGRLRRRQRILTLLRQPAGGRGGGRGARGKRHC